MKNEILEGLKTKFDGVQESVLSRIADKLAKTAKTIDDAEKAIDAVTFQQVIDSYADSRVTEATASAVANYEKKHGLKDGKTVKPEAEPEPKPGHEKKTAEDENEPAWAKALRESNELLQKKLAALETDQVVKSRTKKLTAAFEEVELPEAFRSTYTKSIAKMSFESDEDYDAYIDEIKKELQPIAAELKQKKVVIGRPLTGGNPEPAPKVPDEVQAWIDARKKETEDVPIKGLPKN